MKYCALQSGSSGNCHYIEYEDTKILVDAGLNGKQTALRLEEIGVSIADINAILLTHEHRDHVAGVGVLSRRHHIPVYANAATHEAANPIVRDLGSDMRKLITGPFRIGELAIYPIETSHDAKAPCGYVFEGRDGEKLTVLTDTGCVDEYAHERARGSQLYFIESNHDVPMLLNGPYPYPLKLRIMSEHGHLSNEDAARFLLRQEIVEDTIAILGHLSGDNNTEQLAMQTVETMLRDAKRMCKLHISPRHTRTPLFYLTAKESSEEL